MLSKQYWFPAKRYGWGWGPPSTWQGWLVLVLYFGGLAVGAVVLRADRDVHAFLAFLTFLSVLLVLICWLTGEPPRWRWGKD
jgi:hypothetical protein